jgi:hypothetical protein
MTYEKPDGKIELATSLCGCCPPGQREVGLHENKMVNWWRVRLGALPPLPWTRDLNPVESRMLASHAKTVDDFVTAKNIKVV